jgi:maleate cis-trans isomerase
VASSAAGLRGYGAAGAAGLIQQSRIALAVHRDNSDQVVPLAARLRLVRRTKRLRRQEQTVIDMTPRHQFGYINPVQISDYIHYQFYSIFPANCLMVNVPLNLQNFSHAGVDKALEAFWGAFDFLVARKVERISLGGIPISAYAGRKRILAMLEEAAKRASVPTTDDFEEAIEAIRYLGIKRLAVAAKWSRELMQEVRAYLGEADINVVDVLGNEHSAQQVVALKPQDSIDVALALGREAFTKMPEADGLLLAGGAWLVMQAVPALEAEFGKPIVTNPGASYWAALRQAGLRPNPGFGRLIDSLR